MRRPGRSEIETAGAAFGKFIFIQSGIVQTEMRHQHDIAERQRIGGLQRRVLLETVMALASMPVLANPPVVDPLRNCSTWKEMVIATRASPLRLFGAQPRNSGTDCSS
jgi:hypothetical protein